MLYICYTIDNRIIDLQRPSICFNYTDAMEELVLNFKQGLISRISDYLFCDPAMEKILPKKVIEYLKTPQLIRESKLKEVPLSKITGFIDMHLENIEWSYTTDSYSIFDYGIDNYEEYGCVKNMDYFKNIDHFSQCRKKKGCI